MVVLVVVVHPGEEELLVVCLRVLVDVVLQQLDGALRPLGEVHVSQDLAGIGQQHRVVRGRDEFNHSIDRRHEFRIIGGTGIAVFHVLQREHQRGDPRDFRAVGDGLPALENRAIDLGEHLPGKALLPLGPELAGQRQTHLGERCLSQVIARQDVHEILDVTHGGIDLVLRGRAGDDDHAAVPHDLHPGESPVQEGVDPLRLPAGDAFPHIVRRLNQVLPQGRLVEPARPVIQRPNQIQVRGGVLRSVADHPAQDPDTHLLEFGGLILGRGPDAEQRHIHLGQVAQVRRLLVHRPSVHVHGALENDGCRDVVAGGLEGAAFNHQGVAVLDVAARVAANLQDPETTDDADRGEHRGCKDEHELGVDSGRHG